MDASDPKVHFKWNCDQSLIERPIAGNAHSGEPDEGA
jgi:hypothetical protein